MTDISVPLHVTRRGHGPRLVFVHGLDSDAGVWDPLVERLVDRHECVTVELPGHGRAPVADDERAYERDPLVAALADVIHDGTHPRVLVGHSLGGYLGLALAIARSDAIDGLVCIATGPGFRDPASRERWNERVREQAPAMSIPDEAAAVGLHADSFVIDHLGDIRVPVLAVVGSDDRAYLGANDYLERKVPDIRRLTVEGGRHYVMRSHADLLADAIAAFVAELS